MKKLKYAGGILTFALLLVACEKENFNSAKEAPAEVGQNEVVEFSENDQSDLTGARFIGPLAQKRLKKLVRERRQNGKTVSSTILEYTYTDTNVATKKETNIREGGGTSITEFKYTFENNRLIQTKSEEFSDDELTGTSNIRYTYTGGRLESKVEISTSIFGPEEIDIFRDTTVTQFSQPGPFNLLGVIDNSGENSINKTTKKYTYDRFGNKTELVLERISEFNGELFEGELIRGSSEKTNQVDKVRYTGRVINPFFGIDNDPVFPETRFFHFYYNVTQDTSLKALDENGNEIAITGDDIIFTPGLLTNKTLFFAVQIDNSGYPVRSRGVDTRVSVSQSNIPEEFKDNSSERYDVFVTYEYE